MERRSNDEVMIGLLRDIRSTQLEQAEKQGQMRGDVDGIALRIGIVEKANTRHWWVTVCIAPALALAHGIARKLGVQI